MPQKVAVSVIVPIYNAEKYLHDCLEAIAAQTFKNFDVIMIDDGSEDSGGEIAKKYSEKDSRFVYKRVERNGVAMARNAGLELADGEYIAFVDSDDRIERNYIEELYNAAVNNNCMISSCNYSVVRNGIAKPVRVRKLRSGVYSKEFYLKRVIRDWSVRSYLWNKLWHRSLFFDNDITFPKMYFEDIATVARLVYHTNSVAVVDKPLYNYYIRSNSIMTSVKVEKINDYILSYGILRNYIFFHGDGKRYRMALFGLAVIIYFANYYNIFKLHCACRNFKGWIRNQHISNKNIIYFASGACEPTADYPKLPQYICYPE